MLHSEHGASTCVPVVASLPWLLPFDSCTARELKRGARVEISEQQSGFRIQLEITEAVEQVVASVIRPPQLLVEDSYKAGWAAAVRSVADRMGAMGSSQGKRFKLHPPAAEFARFHGAEIRACRAGDAKRKGKVERPFRSLKETFLEEQRLDPPESLSELNARVGPWLVARVHTRPNRTTGVTPDDRLGTERELLAALPRRRFDTAYIEVRRVHVAVPQIEWRGVCWSVPPACVGQRVEVRHEVDTNTVEIRWAGQLVRRHRLAASGVREVWDGDDWAAAQAAAMGERPRLVVVAQPKAEPQRQCRIELDGDYDVDAIDLSRYDLEGGAAR